MNLDERMKRYRTASRELYNNYFRIDDPWHNDGWIYEERFRQVQQVLFEKLVLESDQFSVKHGCAHTDVHIKIMVKLSDQYAPVMINREINCGYGYWDYPIKEITKDAQLLFISFFDWDQLEIRDNQYVHVLIEQWQSHTDTVGRHALIEARHVKYAEG